MSFDDFMHKMTGLAILALLWILVLSLGIIIFTELIFN